MVHALEPCDWRHDERQRCERGNFRLHPMGPLRLSEGCITVVNPDAFDGLQKYIRSQGLTTPVPGTTMKAYGTVEVK